MNYACELLAYGKHTVTQIAEICGYENVYAFSAKFKEFTGASPTAFAKNNSR